MGNSQFKPDSAGVFACAFSLWEACNTVAKNNPDLNLSDSYNGYDQLMREVMRIGAIFESWACEHVDFDEFSEVWPYMLGDRFGEICVRLLGATNLASFSANDCLRIALKLCLPIKYADSLPIPIDIVVPNPIADGEFKSFRIQTVRENHSESRMCPFTVGDDPYDADYDLPIFGIYGIESDGTMEHIADRRDFKSSASLLRKLVPKITLPDKPVSFVRGS